MLASIKNYSQFKYCRALFFSQIDHLPKKAETIPLKTLQSRFDAIFLKIMLMKYKCIE